MAVIPTVEDNPAVLTDRADVGRSGLVRAGNDENISPLTAGLARWRKLRSDVAVYWRTTTARQGTWLPDNPTAAQRVYGGKWKESQEGSTSVWK